MNTTWLTLTKERRMDMLNQAAEFTGLPVIAIEKDWWVTLALNACFSLPYSEYIIFKGGTSLSKAWNLIERFSEDIDLAIDRKFFGFEENITKTQIRKLRTKSCEFISTTLVEDLKNVFTEWNAINECSIVAQEVKDHDKDPQIIEIHYNSVFDAEGYLPQKVLIEIGSRSLTEPTEQRAISSILSLQFPELNFASKPFSIASVLPQRTFLEKVFLLHEEFSQAHEKIRVHRLTRHLYDLEKLMDTEHGIEALNNITLYNNIVTHREKFNAVRGIDYTNHTPDKICIIPPQTVIKRWEQDYQTMTGYMFFGNYLTFNELINRIAALQKRINEIKLK
jgi:predicted nucleotidyltransferase component of viral defense system